MYTIIDHIEKKKDVSKYQVFRENEKFYLVLPQGDELEFDKLRVLIDIFMSLRKKDYREGKDVEIYDRDKRIRYRKIHRILVLFERMEEERLMRNRIKRHRLVGTKRVMPVSKIDPRLTRPILREEKTW